MTSKSSKRVLIVDDDAFVIRILAKILQKEGYMIDTAESGQEALAKFETSIPCDAAIIDVRLQEMSGLDLLDKLHEIAPCMVKILLTGHPSDEDRARALRQGADQYFAKPVKAEELIKTLENKLDEHRTHLAHK